MNVLQSVAPCIVLNIPTLIRGVNRETNLRRPYSRIILNVNCVHEQGGRLRQLKALSTPISLWVFPNCMCYIPRYVRNRQLFNN